MNSVARLLRLSGNPAETKGTKLQAAGFKLQALPLFNARAVNLNFEF
jgi:hypothetical protein